MAQKPALGKGLASLIPAAAHPNASHPASQTTAKNAEKITPPPHPGAGATAAGPAMPALGKEKEGDKSGDTNNKDRHMGISMAPIGDIEVNQFQPRRDFDDVSLKELSQSILTSGIIQPLVVRKQPGKENYELIAGERRLRAAKLAGLKQVPIVIRKSTDRETLELALIENIQRQDLNCVDEALAYFQLIQDFSLKQEDVADRVGKERATVANYLRLLRLPEEILEDLKAQRLSFGHGKALLALDDNEFRMRARAIILEKHLSVRETEALVDSLKAAEAEKNGNPAGSKSPKSALAQRFMNLSHELARVWSTRIEIKGSESRGKIVIHYSSRRDLDRIIEGMQEGRSP